MKISTEYIGIFAGTCTTVAFFPQVVKLFLNRSTENISLWTYIVFFIGVFTWIIYGFLIQKTVIVTFNFFTLTLIFCIMIAFYLYPPQKNEIGQDDL